MTSELLQKNLLGKSDTQTITEKIVRDQISKKWGIEFESGILEINDTKFQVDFFNKQQMIYGEIYAGIDFLKPGQTRKVAMDILKLLTIEKLTTTTYSKFKTYLQELNVYYNTIFNESSKQKENYIFALCRLWLRLQIWQKKTVDL